jgi:hypothetical protein
LRNTRWPGVNDPDGQPASGLEAFTVGDATMSGVRVMLNDSFGEVDVSAEGASAAADVGVGGAAELGVGATGAACVGVYVGVYRGVIGALDALGGVVIVGGGGGGGGAVADGALDGAGGGAGGGVCAVGLAVCEPAASSGCCDSWDWRASSSTAAAMIASTPALITPITARAVGVSYHAGLVSTISG